MDIDRLRLAVAAEANATAHTLTVKRLRRMTIPIRLIADEVTKAVERRIEHLFATSQFGSIACRADCAYCCHVPRVLVTLPELARILESVRAWPADQIEALKPRLVAQIGAQSSDVAPASRPPCGLLVDDRCSVYDARPLVCRGQHAYDMRECQVRCETGAGETTQLRVVVDAVRGAVSGVVSAFDEMGVAAGLFDLSCALLIALENPKILAHGTSGLSLLGGRGRDVEYSCTRRASSERAQRVSHRSGAGLQGPRERECRGVRWGEAPRRTKDAR